MLAKIYLETIDPEASYYRLLQFDILFSIIFHVFLYISVLYTLDLLFDLNLGQIMYKKIAMVLFVVMIIGYFGRLMRSKNLFNELSYMYPSNIDIRLKTIDIMNNSYFQWYFLG